MADKENAAVINNLMQLAQVNPLLKNMLNLAMAQAQQGNHAQLDKIVQLAQQERQPDKLGFFGRMGQGLKNAFLQGASSGLIGATSIGLITYYSGGDPRENKEKTYESDKNYALMALKGIGEKVEKPNFFDQAHKESGVSNENEKDQKFRDKLNELVEADQRTRSGGVISPRHNRKETAIENAKFSGIIGAVVGFFTGFVGRFSAAPEERNQEIIAWNIIHGRIGGSAMPGMPQGGLPEGGLPVPNLPYPSPGMGQETRTIG